MPFILKNFIWLLPLTHTSLGLRSNGEDFYSMLIHPGMLLLYFIIASAAGVRLCKKAE
jgi:hypothetical protein